MVWLLRSGDRGSPYSREDTTLLDQPALVWAREDDDSQWPAVGHHPEGAVPVGPAVHRCRLCAGSGYQRADSAGDRHVYRADRCVTWGIVRMFSQATVTSPGDCRFSILKTRRYQATSGASMCLAMGSSRSPTRKGGSGHACQAASICLRYNTVLQITLYDFKKELVQRALGDITFGIQCPMIATEFIRCLYKNLPQKCALRFR